MSNTRHYGGNPQKNSPALGATLAYMGINGLLAMLHGSQGCSTFIRLQLSRHFKEPIPLNSTALLEDSAIFGGWDHLKQGIVKSIDKFRPQIIGVMSTGLTETYGDDMESALAELRLERPDLEDFPVVLSRTPDYTGSMQEGYQQTVSSLLATLLKSSAARTIHSSSQSTLPAIALFPGVHLSPGDVAELKEIVSLFGFQPLVVPDLSTSLDGHTELEPVPVVQGGTTLTEILQLPYCKAAFSFGLSMNKVGQYFQEKYQVPHLNLPSLTGVAATDTLVLALADLAEKPVPAKLQHQRSQLLDTYADYHDQIGGKQIALALETDLLYSLATALLEVGAEITTALGATEQEMKRFPPTIPVQVGDLEDLEEQADGSNLIIANSNGRQAASALRLPHLRAGLPVFDRAGENLKVWTGYRGTRQFLVDVLNTMAS
ncbi:nitrogenase iron-molybdenum cofactor biosynthesis protein NifN [Paradesulfitobacterium ferrireducens]|uniref:nitrogenase iron-molybdenum cofactor biosynthesis protein NifN n=1 Tax=Paradesulfitobacterium ferrireducens TaxID=2816476 RepID=UPI001A8D509B|nr:nitrogenase iron-molybdenum cofactor biosynthesis protein NifN [Paradesulfitobacterium ferrireducens]